jgi:hypothetical protein
LGFVLLFVDLWTEGTILAYCGDMIRGLEESMAGSVIAMMNQSGFVDTCLNWKEVEVL